MNRMKSSIFWVLVAINIALALAVTMRLSLPDLRPQSAVHFPATGTVLAIFLATQIFLGTAISIGERLIARRSADAGVARGLGAIASVWWIAGVGWTIAVLAYQFYLIGWSRGALPPLDQIRHLRVMVTLVGIFQIYTGNAWPRSALALSIMSPGVRPEITLREARHYGWVETLYGVFLLVIAWTTPPVVLGSLWLISVVALFAYKVVRQRILTRQGREQAGEGAA